MPVRVRAGLEVDLRHGDVTVLQQHVEIHLAREGAHGLAVDGVCAASAVRDEGGCRGLQRLVACLQGRVGGGHDGVELGVAEPAHTRECTMFSKRWEERRKRASRLRACLSRLLGMGGANCCCWT